jgi:hypothetical protein
MPRSVTEHPHGAGDGHQGSSSAYQDRSAPRYRNCAFHATLTFGKGCLTCRKRKVKCDELKPDCWRCVRLQRVCAWSDELQVIPNRREWDIGSSMTIMPNSSGAAALQLSRPSGQNFTIDFPNLKRPAVPYMRHFITFVVVSSPIRMTVRAIRSKRNSSLSQPHRQLYCMLWLRFLQRTCPEVKKLHELTAAHHYSLALRALNSTLSDPAIARADSTIGACLLLCVYEVKRLSAVRSIRIITHML